MSSIFYLDGQVGIMGTTDYELIGHEYWYAVDQTAAALNLQGSIRSKLTKARKWVTASCDYNGHKGFARIRADSLDDRNAQRIIKTSIYRAARASGMERRPWGSLTGVRPGKLMRQMERVNQFISEFDVEPDRAQLCEETTRYTEQAEKTLSPGDICLYVGVPFCPTRCAYCSFISSAVEKNLKLIDRFVEALCAEIDGTVLNGTERVVSVYFGGGTPTTLSAEQLDEVISRLERKFSFSSVRDFTVEAGRPDTITDEKLEVLRRHHVTRVSVNPQTMNDSVLETIGRKHTVSDVLSALELVRSFECFDINMDLIAGLPSDTKESFCNTIDRVLTLKPENITVHTLSLKNGSWITLNKTAVPSAEEVKEMLDYSYSRLRSSGYSPYYLYRQKNMSGGFENTGWTTPGHANLYNICMMEELCTVLAFGAGGSTKTVEGETIRRIINPKYPKEYIEKYLPGAKDKK